MNRRVLWSLVALAWGVIALGAQTEVPAPGGSNGAVETETVSDGSLTLSQSLARALEGSPSLAAYAWDIRAAEARTLQAGLRPNPELSLEIEGIRWRGGPSETVRTTTLGVGVQDMGLAPLYEVAHEVEEGAGSGFSEAEYTLLLSQLVELGGKRAKRTRLAERDVEATRWDYEVARADVLTDVARAFAETVAAQLRTALSEELVRVAEEVRRTTEAQVTAGRVSPLEERKARVEAIVAGSERQRAIRELEATRSRLASTWGATDPDFAEVAGDFGEVSPIPALSELRARAAGNPDVARWTSELERRTAAHRLERARRIPDVTVGLGLKAEAQRGRSARSYSFGVEGIAYSRTENEPSRQWDTSIVLEFSLPLPIFDGNQGNIREAQYLVEKTADERRAAEVNVDAALAEWHHLTVAALEEAKALGEEAFPEAARTFDLTQEGFRQGKFEYLDVLDAQRTLFDLRIRLVDAQLAYHLGRAEIERLIGAVGTEDAALKHYTKGTDE